MTEEIQKLVAEHGAMHVVTADLLLDYRHLHNFFVEWQTRDLDVTFFFEIKPNLSRPPCDLSMMPVYITSN